MAVNVGVYHAVEMGAGVPRSFGVDAFRRSESRNGSGGDEDYDGVDDPRRRGG
jgi:hypothetical protein